MSSKISYLTTRKINNQTCRHYWLIEAPVEKKSMGVCKYCGEEKEFTNYFQDILKEQKSNN